MYIHIVLNTKRIVKAQGSVLPTDKLKRLDNANSQIRLQRIVKECVEAKFPQETISVVGLPFDSEDSKLTQVNVTWMTGDIFGTPDSINVARILYDVEETCRDVIANPTSWMVIREPETETCGICFEQIDIANDAYTRLHFAIRASVEDPLRTEFVYVHANGCVARLVEDIQKNLRNAQEVTF